jgi:hypothetical protein
MSISSLRLLSASALFDLQRTTESVYRAGGEAAHRAAADLRKIDRVLAEMFD